MSKQPPASQQLSISRRATSAPAKRTQPQLSRSRLLPFAALALVACGDPGHAASPTSHAGGTTAVGTTGGAASTGPGMALAWDAGGFVAPDSNPFHIQGPFYFYSDCDPPSGLPCTAPDPTITGADGKPGWAVTPTGVCIKGTAVKVENSMFSKQWGAGLALDLNSKGGDPGMPAVKGTFNLTQAGIRGFSVDISGTAPAGIRINLTMPGLNDSNFVDAKVPGTTTFDVANTKQGSWVTTKTPLDPAQVEAIQFQVFTTAGAPTPYDFCIDAIRVIGTDGAAASAGGSGAG